MHHCENPNNPNNPAAGISGGVCVNHLWPVVAGGGVMKDEALKLALEALILKTGMNPVMQGICYVMHPEALQAVIDEAIKQALAAQPVPVQPVPWSQALESVWAEPDDTPPAAQLAPLQEPVAWWNGDYGSPVFAFKRDTPGIGLGNLDARPLYTTPPAAQPAVPDAIHHTDLSEHPQYIEGRNDCRAEMLKGMKP
jgi:hypothetical protein